MISFRYHIVSIVSVFLALAVGVALGGGPLKGEVDNTLVEQVRSDRETKARLRADIASLRGTNDFTDAFADTVAPSLVGGILKGRAVTIVVLPTAVRADVAALGAMVGTAGGRVGGTVQVGSQMLDVEQKQLVEQLAGQLLDSLPDVSVPADANGYEQMGALMARAIGTNTDPRGARVDGRASNIRSALSTAGLMTVDGDLERRGSLVLFVTGPGKGSPEVRQAANSIATTLVTTVDSDTDGVVVAGPAESARTGGLLNALREDVVAAQDVSTVDVSGRSAGRVVAVMALAGQARGQSGQYGAVDAADGAMPGGVFSGG